MADTDIFQTPYAMETNTINRITFGVGGTHLTVCRRHTISVYKTFPFERIHHLDSVGGSLAQTFGKVVFVVGSGEDPAFSPRLLKVLELEKGTEYQKLMFQDTVKRVVFNEKQLCVVQEHRIEIFAMHDLSVTAEVAISSNPRGVAELCRKSEVSALAYPSSEEKGSVSIMDAIKGHVLSVVEAHSNPVSAMAINDSGTLLATASVKGTVFRVFSLPEGTLLRTFRRGMANTAVQSLAFSKSTNGQIHYLAAAGSNGSVHVFKMDLSPPSGYLSTFSSYVPSAISDLVAPERHFCMVRISEDGSPPAPSETPSSSSSPTPPPHPHDAGDLVEQGQGQLQGATATDSVVQTVSGVAASAASAVVGAASGMGRMIAGQWNSGNPAPFQLRVSFLSDGVGNTPILFVASTAGSGWIHGYNLPVEEHGEMRMMYSHKLT